ncbi:centrosomal protein of 57 kDa [Echinops telfairi]|uniref:Centrosomal protein of 57 kDa n=1 Tax=Echinops telfairi TaxID=9371 RepID=A0ABM0ZRY8_ECHTE|nr:centrosomal protein of 57 kDa [Echinops telfairi]
MVHHSSYVVYPPDKPFLNSDMRRSPNKPTFAYPESNSRDTSKLEKLDLLEQEYNKLTTMQALAEKKMQELEAKLREEEQERKRMQLKAAQLQTGLETNRIIFEEKATPCVASARRIKKKKSKPPEKRGPRNYFAAQPHYRLCLGDMPFVAGKSTSPSHAVVANVQHVLHLMKQHSKALCNDRHQQLAKLIQESPTVELKEDLECELETLVGKMEAKANQITKVRKYQSQVTHCSFTHL